jgi:hypothetical protein
MRQMAVEEWVFISSSSVSDLRWERLLDIDRLEINGF